MSLGSKNTLSSMTGFGSAARTSQGLLVEVEIKSVNHRFLDIVQKLPRPFVRYEFELRDLIAKQVQRGRVELYVTRSIISGELGEVGLNLALFDRLLKDYKRAFKHAGIKQPPSAAEVAVEILRKPEVFASASREGERRGERELLFSAVSEALNTLISMRRSEGKQLSSEIMRRIRTIRKLSARIARTAPQLPALMRQRLEARLSQVAGDVSIDPARLAQELCLYADKLDVTEELVRIDSHLSQWEWALRHEPVGRRFEFLIQELGREFNTIGNKVQDAAVQSMVIDSKMELEKIREQVQNVE